MRVSVLETKTFEIQSQLSRPRLREVSLNFEAETETRKLMTVDTETKTETTNRIKVLRFCYYFSNTVLFVEIR